MGSVFITRRGGGSGLNFNVVGGTSAPASPAENTIWVNTSTTITSWEFGASEPASPVEGLVWLKTGTASTAEFNALKKNAIQLYPIMAYQYISGAWVSKAAKTYIGGTWVDWATYLINDGVDNAVLTGGWQHATMGLTTTDWVYPDIDFSDGAMSALHTTGTSAVWCISTINAIDLTDVNTIEITCDAYAKGDSYPTGGEAWVDLSIATTPSSAKIATVTLAKNTTASGTFVLDVSSVTGSYYIGFRSHNWVNSGLQSGVTVYNLELKR